MSHSTSTTRGLNAAQRAAVEHGDGPLLVLAGAGSGKTRVITRRIAALVARGVPPGAILAVSFTNKAAEEMVERMVPLVGRAAASKLWMSTFHSFGVRFVNEERERLGLGKRFVIFDQGDSLGVVKDILGELRRSGAARRLDPMAVLARISNWKNELVAPSEVPEADFEYDDIAREVYPEYCDRLTAMRALDFDDLVVVPARLLASCDATRGGWRRRFQHLLIDEFQDTNKAQLELVKQLAGRSGNVCVVGDDDQAIYGWRGADVRNILELDRHFHEPRLIKLEDNYRSRSQILEVANAAIAQSARPGYQKVLRAARGPGEPVRLCEVEDPGAEAKLLAREIRDLRERGVPLGEMAVLYRSNLQARVVEEELRAEGIGYRLFGGTQFFDRREVKDCAAYLRAVINPRDDISLRRIVNYPARGIGAKTIARIDEHARAHSLPFMQALSRVEEVTGVPANARASIDAFVAMLDRARKSLSDDGSMSAVARRLMAEVDMQKALSDAEDGSSKGAVRWSNVEHLLGWLERFERDAPRDRRSLQAFLERVTLRGDPEEAAGGDVVTLATLHASKGLEFDVVFLIGCVEGQLPHSRTTDPKVTEVRPADVEEERRLFYVGVTRARDRLYLTRSKKRLLRGKPTELAPSRFLEGLDDLLEPYQRAETRELDFDEVAELGRRFLAQRAAAARDS